MTDPNAVLAAVVATLTAAGLYSARRVHVYIEEGVVHVNPSKPSRERIRKALNEACLPVRPGCGPLGDPLFRIFDDSSV